MDKKKQESLGFNSDFYQNLYQRAELKIKEDPHKKEALELLKCIQAYRSFPDIADLIKNSPSLIHQLEDLRLLWLSFSKMKEEQISEIAMNLIQDLS